MCIRGQQLQARDRPTSDIGSKGPREGRVLSTPGPTCVYIDHLGPAPAQWSFNVAIALGGTLFTVVISITATVVPTLIPVTCTNITITRPSRVTRSVTFRITNEAFSAALGNPASLEYQLLSENIRHQLQSIYHEAFSSFQGVGDLLFRPQEHSPRLPRRAQPHHGQKHLRGQEKPSAGGQEAHIWFCPWLRDLRPDSAAVNASLVFGGPAPGPSACEVLWTLYRKVKAAEKMLGNLSLDESSLASDGSNLTDLALETISIRLMAMRPFQPLLLLPGSAPFVLLEKTILRQDSPQVTPVVSGFYTAHPQEDPLLLFSNADQWVGVYIEYKFQTPIGTHLPGLASHLAWNIMDPAVQKSSIMANAEKAEMVQYEVWLQILDQPFTKALRDKSGPKSQQLRGMLTRWLTTVLRPLQNFGQGVVEKFQPEPLTARVGATFFRAAPARALVQDCVLRGLHALQEAEGLSVEMVLTRKACCGVSRYRAFHSQRLNPDNESQSRKAPPEVTQQGGLLPS
ncbi:hypothetical protein J1605_021342 [Eschrichtius robustus]|uniref:SEA domain-containing protein n=1 Tax=Eschrichtius robustus TaxID=9764 RepID=A0AB34HHA0_ESCRO|nr:hypothetical protein J1605_021342 [Eschrichtius robustus]